MQFIPHILLHLNYFLLNRNDTLDYDPVYKTFCFKKDARDIHFGIDDIVQVRCFKSYAFHKDNLQLLTWDSYFHHVITLKDSTVIKISSLMIGAQKIEFETDIVNKLNLYRWAFGSSLKTNSV
jgi:hypothetical protein